MNYTKRVLKRRLIALFLVCFALSSCERLKVEGMVEVTRSIRDAQALFRQNHGRYGSMNELAAEQLIDSSLQDGRSYGHVFDLSSSGDKYRLLVVPEDIEHMRQEEFYEILTLYVDETGQIRANVDPASLANSSSEAIRNQ